MMALRILFVHGEGKSKRPMRPRHTPAMDGGSAVFAGAKNSPYILYIAALSHPCDRGIPYILYIAALSHPCDRGIPYILYIKKPDL